MFCNFCNGIFDSFAMVLEFSVMVLLFFSAGLPHCFYIVFIVILKAVVDLGLFL